MKTIVLLSLAIASVAHADKEPACEVKGSPIFEIEHLTTASKAAQTVKLYTTGAWAMYQVDADGKATAHTTGCVAPDDMKKLRAELAAAKWKITTARIRCMARSASYSRYLVDGKPVFESHVCDGQSLDEASQKALQDAQTALAPAFNG